MRLNRVQIKNFRSIKDVTVELDPSCRVLVGINESGKSNILKAFSLLGDIEPNKIVDLREALPDESPIKESYVRFVFNFDKTESDDVVDRVLSNIYCEKANPDVLIDGGKNLKISEACHLQKGGLYTIDILTEEKSFRYWSFETGLKIVEGWKKPTDACPADFEVEAVGGNIKIKDYKLINLENYTSIPDGYLDNATAKDVTVLIGSTVTEVTEDNLPDTIFWEYDEKNLLPSSVSIVDFSANPKICTPLKNMFVLAGINDIKTSIEEVRKGTPNQIQNYLDSIAKKTTNHFKNVWKEYKSIEFTLHLNADQIIPGVKEKNTHDFARRSDGFKRFVTFLLMVSVNVKTDNISDTLLIIDEPDISLHPSGARFLRDELIRISKTNYVVYSTHSIFMIDAGEISRHYIVRKKDEITSVEVAGDSNVADEEVLFNALGYSVFSVLKEKNIIFEGWNDKALFLSAISNNKNLEKKFKNIGICHARGVPHIKNITPMMELAKRKCLIMSDSDAQAIAQKESYLKIKGYGDWKTYQDIDSSVLASTGEDFVKNDFIAKKVNEVLGSSISFDKAVLPPEDKKVDAIQKFLRDNGLNQDQIKDTITRIKDSIFQDLKGNYIEDKYIKLLQDLAI